MIKAWAGGLCALAVAAAMVRILAPDGSMGKMLKLILGAMTLCVMIGPLLQMAPNLSSALQQAPDTSVPSGFSAVVQNQMQAAARKQAETVAAAQLADAKISCREIHVEMDTSQSSGIRIVRVTVSLQDQTQAARAQKLLEDTFGTAVEVKIRG
ncbi:MULTISPECIES: stage III sporulation protein AF [Caproicibacterium]|uniref:Stage III sporulation protein AF n=1 Tax=Caproicibacterium argilliputei TaxID=3030016 RepID=A0AA97DAH3_9FIRM|nr:stage III sporulation protein AF [Caproicibacterium argilliputei]WOC33311.1 stage III sporulation protein AF [Caproicibacterium argilliputei]